MYSKKVKFTTLAALLFAVSFISTPNHASASVNIDTDPATSIGTTTAVVGGTLHTTDWSLIPIEVGIKFGNDYLIANADATVGPFTYTLTDLTCNTTYSYYAYATNHTLVDVGLPVLSFTTLPCAVVIPTVKTGTILGEATSGVTTTTANITAQVLDAGGEDAHVTFEYGTTSAYGSVSDSGFTAPSNMQVNHVLGNLTCGTLYHYRGVGTNSAGSGTGEDMTFTTSPCTPSPTVTTRISFGYFTTAYIEGDVNNGVNDPDGPFTGGFEYGLTDSYGTTIAASPAHSIGAGIFSVRLDGLTCDTQYHFRAFASNTLDVKGYGNDAIFTTWPCEDSVVTNTATAITQTSAVLNGQLNHSLLALDGIHVGFTVGADHYTANENAGMGPFSYTLSNLVCGTEYTFTAYATDGEQTLTGSSVSFTTSPCSTSGGGGGGGGGNSGHACNLGRVDANGDCRVEVLDFVILMAHWNQATVNDIADFNSNRKVEMLDFVLLMAKWTK